MITRLVGINEGRNPFDYLGSAGNRKPTLGVHHSREEGSVGPGPGNADEDVKGLIEKLQAPDADVRTAAAFALGKRYKEASFVVPALIAAMGDSKSDVRTAVEWALRRIKTLDPTVSMPEKVLNLINARQWV